MNIAFTICSNNYLAHAKTLGDSFLKHHPDFTFFIALVDKRSPDVDYSAFSRFTLIDIEDVTIENFDQLVLRFNITELNTTVKPFVYRLLFEKYKGDKVIYIDPDILVFNRFTEVIDALDTSNIVITPHIFSGVDDGKGPSDLDTLQGGVYNLGFIGLSDYTKVLNFLDWWQARIVKYGFCNPAQGMFYDQIWVNYVPVFYENSHTLKHRGYNMANWNLHERSLTPDAQVGYLVNQKYPLVFFHYSSYKYNKPDQISAYHNRYTFETRPDIVPVFQLYHSLLKENGIEKLSKVPCVYYEIYKEHKAREEYHRNNPPSAIRKMAFYIREYLKKKISA